MTDGRRIGIVLGTLAALLVAGCSGGAAGGGDSNIPADGIDRSGITIAQGPISGFGSVIVNGVRYSTSGATVTIDDQPGTESDLKVGQVVRIEATLDAGGTTGVAKKIAFDDDVEGPLQTIDRAASRLVVLGQTVQLSAATSFGDSIVPRGIDGLRIGDRLEVSGLASSGGVIAATRIERKSVVSGFEVKGVAALVDTAARRLSVNQLRVDYSAAQVSGFTGGQPVNGDLIEATGALNASGVLVATRLERRSSSLPGTTNDKAELEGLVTRFASATDFDVAGQRVTTTGSTQYEDGTAAGIALNAAVEVAGAFDASGRIVAQKIEFRRESDLELTGRVDSVNAAGNTLTVLGQPVRTTAQTRFEDKSSADLQRFSLADLRVGDSVEVRGFREGGVLVASLLEREDTAGGAGGGTVEVKGPATAVAAPSFTVAGVLVTTDSRTEFRNKEGGSITAAAFFAAAPGREVKVRGSLVGNTVLAERAELDD